MIQSAHDSCLFYYHYNGKLEGILIIHVDDYLSSGSAIFQTNIIEKLRKTYIFGKICQYDFIFTGFHMRQDDNMDIYINQNNFVENMQLFNYETQNPDNFLNSQENSLLRKTTGQLSWIASQTRPDVSYDAFYLSTILNYSRNRHAKFSKKVLMKTK